MNVQRRVPTVSCWISHLAVLMAMLMLISPAAAQQQRVLESGGIGKVRVGMDVGEVERTIGARLRSLVPGYGQHCWLAVRTDGLDPGLVYMVENGRITRIDVVVPRDGTAPTISTAKGIRIGSPQADVELTYGSNAISALAPYGQGNDDRWITVEATPELGIVISISGGKVVGFWAGRRPSIAYTEACS